MWLARMADKRPNASVCHHAVPDWLHFEWECNNHTFTGVMDRKLARLFARRILEALDYKKCRE